MQAKCQKMLSRAFLRTQKQPVFLENIFRQKTFYVETLDVKLADLIECDIDLTGPTCAKQAYARKQKQPGAETKADLMELSPWFWRMAPWWMPTPTSLIDRNYANLAYLHTYNPIHENLFQLSIKGRKKPMKQPIMQKSQQHTQAVK